MATSTTSTATPLTQTVYQNAIPPELMPYATQILGALGGAGNAPGIIQNQLAPQTYTDPITGQQVQTYSGLIGQMQNVAGFSPLQMQAFSNVQQMQPSAQTQQATGMAGLAGLAAGNIGSTYNPIQGFGPNFYQAPNQQVTTQDYTGANVGQYMSPYQQNVTQQQMNQAIQNYANQLPQLGSVATKAGGLGGSREALMAAQGQQGLQQTLAGIQATGAQNAFQNAQQQFNAQQQARLQAQQANQQAALQQAAAGAQFGLGGANLAQQSQQFGANLGLQGLAQQLAAANTLGNLGQQQFQQQAGINTALLGMGQLQQQQQQNILNTGVANAQLQANYPYQLYGYLSNAVRGTPIMPTGVSSYAAPPNLGAQIANLGLGSLFGSLG